MAWIGAVVGGYLSYQGAREANKNAGKGGFVDQTTWSDPWGPSGNARIWGMDEAYRRLTGNEVPKDWGTFNSPDWTKPGGKGGGVNTGSAGSGNTHGATPSRALPNSDVPAGMRRNARGKLVPAGKNDPAWLAQQRGKPGFPAGGGGKQPSVPTSPAPKPFDGSSAETDLIRQRMIDNADRGNPLYGQAESWTSDTISGDPSRDRNAYRTETADMLRGFDSPELKRYQDMLFGAVEGRGGAGSAARQNALARARSGGGGGALGSSFGASGNPAALAQPVPQAADEGAGPIGVKRDLRSILDGNDTPEAQAMRDRIKRNSDEAYAQRARDVRLRSAGSGMFGGTGWQGAESDALSEYSRNLTDAYAAQDYATYNNALGLATGYDTSSLDRAAQERISGADRAAQERMSGASLAASAGAAASDRESREYLAQLDALGQSVGMGIGLGQYRISGMGSLAEGYSGDQQFAIGNTPDITGLGLRDWGAAGNVSLASDQGRTTWAGDRGRERASERATSASAGAARAALAWDRERYNREAPMRDVANYADILNAFSGNYGTTHQYGLDTRSSSPPVNAWGQALAGAAGGWSLGQGIEDYYRQPRS